MVFHNENSSFEQYPINFAREIDFAEKLSYEFMMCNSDCEMEILEHYT